MKASLVLLLEVLEAIRALGPQLPRPLDRAVHVRRGDRQPQLATVDREPGPRERVRPGARAAAGRRQPQDRAEGGRPVHDRGRGQGRARRRRARAGASAIVELAHQILRIQALNDPAAGTTVNVGVVHGGTTANVVPAWAVAQVDVRATSLAEAATVERGLTGLDAGHAGNAAQRRRRVQPAADGADPGRRRACSSGPARSAAGSGLELTEGSTGGGSDGNFTAALGVPTLDGLGVLGGGAHADDEHIVIDSLPERAALLAALLLNL